MKLIKYCLFLAMVLSIHCGLFAAQPKEQAEGSTLKLPQLTRSASIRRPEQAPVVTAVPTPAVSTSDQPTQRPQALSSSDAPRPPVLSSSDAPRPANQQTTSHITAPSPSTALPTPSCATAANGSKTMAVVHVGKENRTVEIETNALSSNLAQYFPRDLIRMILDYCIPLRIFSTDSHNLGNAVVSWQHSPKYPRRLNMLFSNGTVGHYHTKLMRFLATAHVPALINARVMFDLTTNVLTVASPKETYEFMFDPKEGLKRFNHDPRRGTLGRLSDGSLVQHDRESSSHVIKSSVKEIRLPSFPQSPYIHIVLFPNDNILAGDATAFRIYTPQGQLITSVSSFTEKLVSFAAFGNEHLLIGKEILVRSPRTFQFSKTYRIDYVNIASTPAQQTSSQSNKKILKFEQSEIPKVIVAIPNTRYFVSSCGKVINLWNLDDQSKPVQVLEGHNSEIISMHILNNDSLVSCDEVGVKYTWKIKSSKTVEISDAIPTSSIDPHETMYSGSFTYHSGAAACAANGYQFNPNPNYKGARHTKTRAKRVTSTAAAADSSTDDWTVFDTPSHATAASPIMIEVVPDSNASISPAAGGSPKEMI